jgi:transcriptional regulator with PAS, ATPase and Fis domain
MSSQPSEITPATPLAASEAEHLLKVATESLLGHFADICEGAVIVDRQARVVWMNDSYPKRIGLANPSTAIGQAVESILPSSRMREVVETGHPIMLDIMDIGDESSVVARLPLRNSAGEVIGGIGLILLNDAMSLAPLVSRFNQLKLDFADSQRRLAEARRAKHTLSSIIGASDVCVALKQQARRAAGTRAPVLIQGETGTGKELLAQAIHNASLRADRAFVAVNIAAIPETLLESEFFGTAPGAYTGAERKGLDGKFKLADGGTLFLDEIGDMSGALQAKLLRVLQEGEFEALGSNRLTSVDVRIVAATSRDLKTEIDAGRFRPDLYYRLNVVTLSMPPLRDRLADLPLLCEHMMEALCRKLGLPLREISAEALQRLYQHSWPGNIRELQNVLERALMMSDGDALTLADIEAVLPAPAVPLTPIGPAGLSLAEAVMDAEKSAIRKALASCGGNKARTATELGISRTSLYEKLALLGLG